MMLVGRKAAVTLCIVLLLSMLVFPAHGLAFDLTPPLLAAFGPDRPFQQPAATPVCRPAAPCVPLCLAPRPPPAC